MAFSNGFGIRSIVVAAAVSIWLLLAGQASAGAITSWWTDLGPSLILQDDSSGAIRYSLCNSNNNPILPSDKTITAPLFKYPPKNGTSLAGVGWYDTKTSYASIFYQDDSNEIVNTVLQCDTSTGYWMNTGDYVVSGTAPSISPKTGLAVVLLGSDAGYRVFYHDTNGSLCQLGYTQTTSWYYNGSISEDVNLGTAIGATFTSTDNITVVTPKDAENMEVSRYFGDKTWHVSTFPRALTNTQATNFTNATSFVLNYTSTPNFTLPAWDGSPGALGVAVDKAYTRSVFYIGTDNSLYQVANIGYAWRLFSRPNTTYWPQADDPKAPLAVSSNFAGSQLRVYYMSGGQMIQATGDGGTWTAAAVLPNQNTTASTSSSSSSASGSASSSATADASGLSTGAKAGIGIGVSLGALGIAGMVGALYFLRRRQQRRDAAAAAAAAAASTDRSPVPAYSQVGSYSDYHQGGGEAAPGQGGYGSQPTGWGYKPVEKAPGELDSAGPQVHEMPQNDVPQEMIGEGHYREVP